MKKLTIIISLLLMSINCQAEKLVFAISSKIEFAHPHDLSLGPDNQFLYVSDMNNDVIKVLDPESLETVSSIGDGELSSPHDVAFDFKGRMLVADTGNNRIAIYSVSGIKGKLITELTEDMSGPEGVTSDSDNNIYVANADSNEILKFNDDKLIKSTGGYGSAPGKFIRAHDIEYSQAKLYIGDPGNNRIQILNDDLTLNKIFSAPGKSLNEPKYLGLDNTGTLYVADQHNNLLRVFDKNGNETHRAGKAGNMSLNKIEGVEIFKDRVWVSDTYNDRIVLYKWE